MVKGGGIKRFKVLQDKTTKEVWHIYDNWQEKAVRTYRTREEARWAVKAYNERPSNEMEKEIETDRTPTDDTRQG
jgi:quinol monooxygenase YgiN